MGEERVLPFPLQPSKISGGDKITIVLIYPLSNFGGLDCVMEDETPSEMG
jgi:hypothetical protein